MRGPAPLPERHDCVIASLRLLAQAQKSRSTGFNYNFNVVLARPNSARILGNVSSPSRTRGPIWLILLAFNGGCLRPG
jgi:hypothetical protein